MHAFEENAQFDDNSSVQPVLSVVVIGRNEGQRLARCLESIARIKNVSRQRGDLRGFRVDRL